MEFVHLVAFPIVIESKRFFIILRGLLLLLRKKRMMAMEMQIKMKLVNFVAVSTMVLKNLQLSI